MDWDEKAPLLRPFVRSNQRGPRWEIFLSAMVIVGFVTLGLTITHSTDQNGAATFSTELDSPDLSTNSSTTFSWSRIPPSRTLQWHPCFTHDDQYDCARLDVPMDWADPKDTNRVILAITRLRATNTSTDYRGPVFFNPGGPGGSGIWALKDHGKHLQTIVGANHDIIAFDPRGVGASVPRIDCWDAPQNRHNWAMQATPVIDAHEGLFYDAWSRSAAFSLACEAAQRESGLLEHVGTASHARDLLAILDEMSEGKEAKLRYWGFSYGTILGGVFAAMYPDRVERMVSDGNVDYEEWFHMSHINSVRDADAVMEAFYDLCHQAGPRKCAFHGSSPADIKERHNALLDRLRKQPIIYMPANDSSVLPELITYSKIRKLAATSLYRPNYYFPHLATILAALERNDGGPYYAFVTRTGIPFADTCTSAYIPPTEPLTDEDEGNDDAFPTILCADGPSLGTNPRAFLDGQVREMEAVSRVSGAIVVQDRIACAGRTVKPKFAFTGPFEGKMAGAPVLFVANMADNITPLLSARNNSAGFEGSVVLVQNSYGVSISDLEEC